MKKLLLAAALSSPMLSTFAATYIVDTGAPASPGGYQFSSSQYFAGKFTTSQDLTIDTLETYLRTSSGGTVTFGINADDHNAMGANLIERTAALSPTPAYGWAGVSNVNYRLAAGTYWVTYRPDAAYAGAIANGGANPLANYDQGGQGVWYDTYHGNGFGELGITARIAATAVSPVPEPSPLELVSAASLLMFALSKYKRTRRQG